MKNPITRFDLNLVYNDSFYGPTALPRDSIVIKREDGGYMSYYEHRDIVMQFENEIKRLKNIN